MTPTIGEIQNFHEWVGQNFVQLDGTETYCKSLSFQLPLSLDGSKEHRTDADLCIIMRR